MAHVVCSKPLTAKHTRSGSLNQIPSIAILADFAEAIGLKPRSKPLTYQEAKKAVSELYRPRGAKSRAKP